METTITPDTTKQTTKSTSRYAKASRKFRKNNPFRNMNNSQKRSELDKLRRRRAKYSKTDKYKKVERNNRLKSEYGITVEDYDKLFKEQNECCAICSTPQSELRRRLSVDHCHVTNKIRGLLCDSCNNGLGRFKDSEEILLIAIKYLKR